MSSRFRIGLLEWITAHLVPNFILGWKFPVPTMVESIVFENGQIIQIHVPPEMERKGTFTLNTLEVDVTNHLPFSLEVTSIQGTLMIDDQAVFEIMVIPVLQRIAAHSAIRIHENIDLSDIEAEMIRNCPAGGPAGKPRLEGTAQLKAIGTAFSCPCNVEMSSIVHRICS